MKRLTVFFLALAVCCIYPPTATDRVLVKAESEPMAALIPPTRAAYGKEVVLYYAAPSLNDIYRISPTGGVPEPLNLSQPHCYRPYGIAHDPVRDCIYWTNTLLNSIGRICQGNVSSVALPFGYMRAITIDPAQDLIYATDTGTNTIEIINFDLGTRRTLVRGAIGDPYDIALDSKGGWIYWAEFKQHHIAKARTDGTGHVPLVEKGVRHPKGVALGQNNSRLYFCGEHSIQSIGVDGIDYQTHFRDNAYIFDTMTVDSRFLYVKASRSIWRLAIDSVNATGRDLQKITDTGEDYIGGIVLAEPLLQECFNGYFHYPSTRRMGGNRELTGNTAEKCKNLCDANNKCWGYTFESEKPRCYVYVYRTYRSSTYQYYYKDIAGDYTKLENEAHYDGLKYTDYMTQADCQSLCDFFKSCTGYTIQNNKGSRKICRLHIYAFVATGQATHNHYQKCT